MKQDRLTRRDINKMGMAAFGGLMAGSVAGCGGPQEETPPAEENAAPSDPAPAASDPAASDPAASDPAASEAEASMASVEAHLCRGLNSCKNQGASGDNECAGQGTCSSYAEHSCGGQNECKGQGGCGEDPGLNDCKGEGHCSIPLMAPAWKTVRARFEKEMEAKNLQVGVPPEPSS